MDDLVQSDRETRAFLRDLDNFGRPPPPRHLNTDVIHTSQQQHDSSRVGQLAPNAGHRHPPSSSNVVVVAKQDSRGIAADFVPSDADDPAFLEKVRQFQLNSSHPYASRSRIETTKKIAEQGGGMIALVVPSSSFGVGSSFDSKRASGQSFSPGSNTSSRNTAGSKEIMSKDEINSVTSEVRRVNRPINPWAEFEKTAAASVTANKGNQLAIITDNVYNNNNNTYHNNINNNNNNINNNNGHHYTENGSSSAYSSFNSDPNGYYSAAKSARSPHRKEYSDVDKPSEHASRSQHIYSTPSNIANNNNSYNADKKAFNGFTSAAPKYQPALTSSSSVITDYANGGTATARSTPGPANGTFSPPPNANGRSASYAPGYKPNTSSSTSAHQYHHDIDGINRQQHYASNGINKPHHDMDAIKTTTVPITTCIVHTKQKSPTTNVRPGGVPPAPPPPPPVTKNTTSASHSNGNDVFVARPVNTTANLDDAYEDFETTLRRSLAEELEERDIRRVGDSDRIDTRRVVDSGRMDARQAVDNESLDSRRVVGSDRLDIRRSMPMGDDQDQQMHARRPLENEHLDARRRLDGDRGGSRRLADDDSLLHARRVPPVAATIATNHRSSRDGGTIVPTNNHAVPPPGGSTTPTTASSEVTTESPTTSAYSPAAPNAPGEVTSDVSRVPWRNGGINNNNNNTITITTNNNNSKGRLKPGSSSGSLEEQHRRYERLQAEVERELVNNQQHVYGTCSQCSQAVVDADGATRAGGRLYHDGCFTCRTCGRALRGKRFYEIGDEVLCEEDYLYSGFQQNAERCATCNSLIIDMVLHALGQPYHPACFRCHSCKTCLDGVPFAVDNNGKVFCMDDYHRLYSPVCAACQRVILPTADNGETVRVVAIGRDYHIECYVCEGCGVQLTDEPTRRCFPLGDHLLCHKCHVHWRRTGGADQPITDL